jgi:hypothetical protein
MIRMGWEENGRDYTPDPRSKEILWGTSFPKLYFRNSRNQGKKPICVKNALKPTSIWDIKKISGGSAP